MKKTAIALSAALAVSAALVAFTGCSNKKFDVEDYAVPMTNLEATVSDRAAYTKAEKVTDATGAPQSLVGTLFTVNTADGYRLYDAATGAYANSSSYSSINFSAPLIRLTSYDSADYSTKYSYCKPNGTMLVENLPQAAEFTQVAGYLRSGSVRKTFYKMTYRMDTTSPTETVHYFTYAREEAGGSFVFKEYAESDVRIPGDPAGGDTLNTLGQQATPVTNNLRPASLNGYEYTTRDAGTETYVIDFYLNGEETGSVTIQNGNTLGFIGDSMYYYELTEVDPSATKGYNVVYSMGIGELKFNIEYFRYNLVKDKVSAVKSDYYFANGFDAMYNYAEEDYDAALAYGYQFRNGVATVTMDALSQTGVSSAVYTLVLGEGMKVKYDATEQPIDVTSIRQIANERYLADGVSGGAYLIDKDMEVLAYSSSAMSVYSSLGLITGTLNSKALAIDFDGKVVLGAKYQNLTFYGGYAATTVEGGDGGTMIVSKTTPDGIALRTAVSAAEDDTVTATYGIIVRRPADGTSPETIYTYGGTQLLTMATDERYVGMDYTDGYGIISTNHGYYICSNNGQPVA